MKKFSSVFLALAMASSGIVLPFTQANAAVQPSVTRTQVEQRAMSMINLNWTYSSSKNSNISSSYAQYITQPAQLKNVTTGQMTGIPYDWGGLDGLDSDSYNAPWTNFLDAVNQGAYIGNVNTDAGLGLIPGTAGIDCSGFVQASYNIKDYKQSTSTLLNNYFTPINLSDIKHMDILDKPGDHVVIFDKWGTQNGISGAFTYESTPDQTYGGIQGTKRYFMSMNEINSGYIPGRYKYLADDTQSSTTQTTTSTQTSSSNVTPAIAPGIFAQIENVNFAANFRSNPSTTASIIGTIPKDAIVYLADYSNGWYKVSYNGQVGWVSSTLIATLPQGKYVTIKGATQLNIRSAASSSAYIVGVLTQNQYAQVLGYSDDGNWMHISINGIDGWSSASYLSYIY